MIGTVELLEFKQAQLGRPRKGIGLAFPTGAAIVAIADEHNVDFVEGDFGFADPERFDLVDLVRLAVARLRAKLPAAGVRIVTVRGAGYRLEES